MEGDEKTLDPPVVQPQQGADPQAPESRRSAPLRGLQPPAIIALPPPGMEFSITRLIVRLLENGQAVHPLADELPVPLDRHGKHLDPDRGEMGAQLLQDPFEILLGDDLGGFAGEEQHAAEPHPANRLPFPLGLFRRQRDPGNDVCGVETAVDAAVGADVRQVERGEHPHHPAESLHGQPMGPLGHLLEKGLRRGGKEAQQIVEARAAGGKRPFHVRHGSGARSPLRSPPTGRNRMTS